MKFSHRPCKLMRNDGGAGDMDSKGLKSEYFSHCGHRLHGRHPRWLQIVKRNVNVRISNMINLPTSTCEKFGRARQQNFRFQLLARRREELGKQVELMGGRKGCSEWMSRSEKWFCRKPIPSKCESKTFLFSLKSGENSQISPQLFHHKETVVFDL